MKIFEIINKREKLDQIPTWPSSHAEIRDQLKDYELINEVEITDPDELNRRSQFIQKNFYDRELTTFNLHGAEMNNIHYHKSVKPKNINNLDKNILYSYTTHSSDTDDSLDYSGGIASSKNLNYYLRNRFAGNDINHPAKKQGFIQNNLSTRDENKILKTIKKFDQIFANSKNTNRMKLHTFSGIPTEVSEYLENSEIGSIHTLPSFTSTSVNFYTAFNFSKNYLSDPYDKSHIIHFTLTPGSGISVADISAYSENEILLKYGSKFRYDGSYNVTSAIFSSYGSDTVRIHDVVVFPVNDRKYPALTVDQYGPYHHPSNTTP